MKRRILMLFALVLILTGCGTQQPRETESGSVVVTNVDELLAAIEPYAQIKMEPGVYNLSDAADYGSTAGSEYYTWQETGDGYQLVLRAVDGLVLEGGGKDSTELVTDSRYANVLVLQNCTNVTLMDITAGHTEGSECKGGVLAVLGCKDVKLNGLGLYGCGTIGIWAELSYSIGIHDCEIYDCSFTGIQANRVDKLTVENCNIHDIGDIQMGGGRVFVLDNCSDVTVAECDVTDNTVAYIATCNPCAGVEIRDTVFARNRVEACVFKFMDGGMVVENCSFESNNIRSWFSHMGDTILDGEGKSWTEEMLEVWYNSPAISQSAGEQTQVKVSTVDELIAAIAPDTEIVLADGMYDLSTTEGYGTGYSDYYYWSEEFDGPSLVIVDVNNLTIRSESGDVTKCTISAVPRYANVLSFRNCTNITVSGFTAGHTVEPGYCTGGVLNFQGTDTILVENCGLYGCGILGVQAEMCSDIMVKDCNIYECSYGGIQMGNVNGITIENCTFRDLGGDDISFYDCKNATVDGEAVSGNGRFSK